MCVYDRHTMQIGIPGGFSYYVLPSDSSVIYIYALCVIGAALRASGAAQAWQAG